MDELDIVEARLLQAIADATDRGLPCPPLTFSIAGKFAVKGWIQNLGDGVDHFVITGVGRQIYMAWGPQLRTQYGSAARPLRPAA